MRLQYSFIILSLIICSSTNAEIITDGTLGQNINLPGPDFKITSDIGQQHGNNLFHSFQDFNLNSSESATFSGPDSVQNILSRVTGGNPSNIDGLIRSTILNADMYFLNPYGIMFGPNAQLDVQGSLHASTADYLRLGENGRFDARNPSDSLLTVAPIEAFGFLTNSPATISMLGSQLAIPSGKTLSLIGGDLMMKKTQLFAPAGQINLTSIKGKGEIIPTDVTALSGDIKISNNSLLDISGEGSGNLFIRAGQFVINSSNIKANSLNKDGGKVSIQANKIHFDGGSRLIGQTKGAGNAAKIKLQATESTIFSGKSKAGFSSRIDARAY
ncbi:filamentous hemagglutinin N-terminal domain-containing protein, partial [Thiotrichales bacterium HSG1]|nr:filamentous hemagglutinin N-terminal domain-containing protein [Thiotrichales bacterium HSG1]